jgi:hypothetical protein
MAVKWSNPMECEVCKSTFTVEYPLITGCPQSVLDAHRRAFYERNQGRLERNIQDEEEEDEEEERPDPLLRIAKWRNYGSALALFVISGLTLRDVSWWPVMQRILFFLIVLFV